MLIVRFIKAFFIVWIVLICLGSLGLWVTGNGYLLRAIKNTYLSGYNTAHINDYIDFNTRRVSAGDSQRWLKSDRYNRSAISDSLQNFLSNNQSAAFLIAQNYLGSMTQNEGKFRFFKS